MKEALGIVQVQGLAYTIACADAAAKAANVNLLGVEPVNGRGFQVLKFTGNVGSVKAAIDASLAVARKDGVEAVGFAIPRPSDDCWDLVSKQCERRKKEEVVPEIVEDTVEEVESTDNVEEDDSEGNDEADEPETFTCNICEDPRCTRKKGESHNLCIHYKSKK